MTEFKADCRYFLGDKPCKFHKIDRRICENCKDYDKLKERILLINLEFKGDVLRVTSLIKGLKKKYPNSHITWAVEENSKTIPENNPLVDRVVIADAEAAIRFMVEEFDILINLDKRSKACAMASLVKAGEKKGFGLGEDGNILCFNKEAELLYAMGLSDDIKKANKKTYQEIIFEMADLKYKGEKPDFKLSKESLNFSKEFFKGISEKDIVIGLNTGCGSGIFPNKKWLTENFIELAKMIDNAGMKVLLLGGPEEKERNKKIADECNFVIDSGTDNTIENFAAILNRSNVMVTVDTLAMHIATALDVPLVVLFGVMVGNEIEIYKGEKIQSKLDCSPCFNKNCKTNKCMISIKPEEVFDAIKRVLHEHEKN
ncbi:MAG: glycosyltransferase family 9 protein [Candidatus Aenigmarchaeota archaeon]|nr:glycosyltransferase family 9 protein [Candidatus Aenigmarchaeota archaeon]